MTFRIVGERGELVDEGKSLLALQRRLAPRTAEAVRAAVRGAVRAAAAVDGSRGRPSASAPGADGAQHPLERAVLRTFPDDLPGGRVPDAIESRGPDGLLVRGYPSLVVDDAANVGLRVLTSEAEAAAAYPAALRRLLLLDVGLPPGRVTSRWTGTDALTLATSPYPSTEALVEDVQLAALAALTAGDDLEAVRDRPAYEALADRVRERLEDEVHRVVGEAVRALAASRRLDAAIHATTSLALVGAVTDVRAQQRALVGPGFVAATPPGRSRHLPRYLDAAIARLAKAATDPARDADLARRVRALEEALAAARSAVAAGPPDPPRAASVEEVRWLIEELRVSFFAQQLGTPVPVSEKRITKAIAEI
jgi:ATP-dependent helicase HrpA